jgi:hypothetical protein
MVFLFEEINILDMNMIIYDCKSKKFLNIACKSNNDSMCMGPMISPKKLHSKFSEFAEKFFGEAHTTHITHTISQSKTFLEISC